MFNQIIRTIKKRWKEHVEYRDRYVFNPDNYTRGTYYDGKQVLARIPYHWEDCDKRDSIFRTTGDRAIPYCHVHIPARPQINYRDGNSLYPKDGDIVLELSDGTRVIEREGNGVTPYFGYSFWGIDECPKCGNTALRDYCNTLACGSCEWETGVFELMLAQQRVNE